MRGPVHNHDGEERHKVSLVLFSHPVSEKRRFLGRRSQSPSDCSSSLCSRYSTARSLSRALSLFHQTANRGRSLPQPSRSLSLSRTSSIVCANHSNSLTDALCVFSRPSFSFIDPNLIKEFSSPPCHQRYVRHPLRPVMPPLDVDGTLASTETQPPPSHCKGHSVRQTDIYQLANRIRRDCADQATG